VDSLQEFFKFSYNTFSWVTYGVSDTGIQAMTMTQILFTEYNHVAFLAEYSSSKAYKIMKATVLMSVF
jgi:hypothetical protein